MEGQNDFSHAGQNYYKEGGNTFLRNDEIPGGQMQLHPDTAAALDAQRIELAGGDYDRQEYLRRREEWHNTPDTPNAGPELEHTPPRHDYWEQKKDIAEIRGLREVEDYLTPLVPFGAAMGTGGLGLAAVAGAIAGYVAPKLGANFKNLQPHIDL